MEIPKQFHEAMACFFETPTREALRELLRTNCGERDECDFKAEWPPHLSNIARHILGIANSGGGVIVVGMAEKEDDKSLQPVGLTTILDKAKVHKGVEKFLPHSLRRNVDVLNFSYPVSDYPSLNGKNFQVLLIEDDPLHLPYVCCWNGDKIREAAIYIRRGTSTEEANYNELQEIINRRIETGYSSQGEIELQNHS